MKIKTIAGSILISALFAGCASENHRHDQAALQTQAKVSRADAEKIALGQVPGGSIRDSELEKEKGRVIWSFDVAVPGSADIKEVAIDAVSGQVVSVETETPKRQAKEAAEDAKKKEKDGDKD